MSISRQLRGQVIDLVALVQDGEATGEDRARLQQLISAEEATQRFYIDYCHMAACLRWTLERSPANLGMGGDAVGVDTYVNLPANVETASIPLSHPRTFSIRSLSWLSVAAAIAAVLFWVVVGLVLMPRNMAQHKAGPGERNGEKLPLPPAPAAPVASVVGAWDCRWTSSLGQPTSAVREGQRLAPDRVIELASGQVELRFDDGATVLLEGPSRFTVLSAKQGHLKVGRLGAVVPAAAKGFEIDTPSTLITDLGTEFSVEVDRTGGAEVQVIRGEVQLTPKAELAVASGQPTVRLTQGKAALVGSGDGRVRFVAANLSKAIAKTGKLQISHRTGPPYSFVASATDLIDESGNTLVRAISSVSKARDDSDTKALNNGTIYAGADTTANAGSSALCPTNGMSVTYDLNLEESPAGYDILWIMSISGGAEGRRGQRFRVEVSHVGSDDFSVVADESQLSFADAAEGEMHVRLERTDKEPIGREVDRVRFTFFDLPQAVHSTAYREIDVFGRATRE